MEELLKPVRTKATFNKEDLFIQDAEPKKAAEEVRTASRGPVSSLDEALESLRSKPDFDTLKQVLKYLDPKSPGERNVNINIPRPETAKVVNALVNTIIPDYWSILNEKSEEKRGRDVSWAHPKERGSLLRSLSGVNGLGALLARLGALVAISRDGKSKASSPNTTQHVADILEILNEMLHGTAFIWGVWADLDHLVDDDSRKLMIWKQFLSDLSSGKLLSTAAEAADIFKASTTEITRDYWFTNGSQYCVWIGRSVAAMTLKIDVDNQITWKAAVGLLSKAFGLGYIDQVVEHVYHDLILVAEEQWARFRKLISLLQAHEQRNFFYSLLRILGKRHFVPVTTSNEDGWWHEDANLVSGVTAVLKGVTDDNEELKSSLAAWLTGISGGGVGEAIGIRRAAIATFAGDQERLQQIVEKSMQQFGDKLYIKHTPILQQEVNVQVLLLASGYLHRIYPMYLFTLARSSTHLNGVSNRLAASSPRSRFLGMVVGTVISGLIDKTDKRMNFGTEEMDSPESRWYQSLTMVQDVVGQIESLKTTTIHKPRQNERISTRAKPRVGTLATSSAKIMAIEEIEDSDDDEEGLVPYSKPDSDEEDEDEDPTVVQRNKPTAPVYIRDLLSGLRDFENYDRQRLALSTAGPLIRRKANFGTEVSDHAEELATVLTGLSDKYDMENFQEMRLQAMIAVLLAQPLKMGQWMSKTFFDGDYSMGQRASILSTLCMGARELAGYKNEDGAATGANAVPENAFPSKRLPDRLHNVYALPAVTVDSLARKLEKTMIEPMAAEAADKLSGPNILKVRTFSSRMEVEKRRKKPIANELAKIVADAFFFPLTGRWWVHLKAYGAKSVHFDPFLLATYLKTLSIILHASGSSTLALQQMTSEFWDLLLSLREQSEPAVLEALLFSILTLLDINDDKRRLAEQHSKELLETQEWVGMIFEVAQGGGEAERVRMLAASVLMRTREVVEKYQRLLMGDMFNF